MYFVIYKKIANIIQMMINSISKAIFINAYGIIIFVQSGRFPAGLSVSFTMLHMS